MILGTISTGRIRIGTREMRVWHGKAAYQPRSQPTKILWLKHRVGPSRKSLVSCAALLESPSLPDSYPSRGSVNMGRPKYLEMHTLEHTAPSWWKVCIDRHENSASASIGGWTYSGEAS
ncbi:hypothetical protein PM082_015291 [Marasmius tenuissimus]|nr:hypothetical protein PM082_015291 [Marasmius tenuissimus]